jgi:hypothetical protein
VSASPLIAEFARNAQPRRTVPGAHARNGVSDFVEEDLVNLVIVSVAA